ncbi:hypothetical protein FGB62_62g161 [Gracilaria domingensis]|nr:hypothetical protein FGB62_62g161 [Gracilaria domingensis]
MCTLRVFHLLSTLTSIFAIALSAQIYSNGPNGVPSSVNKVSTFMNSGPDPSLFGTAAVTPAPTAAYEPGVHPRVLFDRHGWHQLLQRYSNADTFDLPTSWSYFNRKASQSLVTSNNVLKTLAHMERDGQTAVYTGEEDLSSASSETLDKLKPLANHIMDMSERHCQSFFLCAVWASVNEKVVEERGTGESFTTTTVDDCIKASVAWAKVLLAHRAVNCAGKCPNGDGASRAFLWDEKRWFQVSNDWYSAGSSLALTLDVLHDRFSVDERRVVLSALALLMYKQTSWGTAVESSRSSPNAEQHPHRIFSNWALYHGHLYITNLVLEGETNFDAYARAVLLSGRTTGFNSGLHHRFNALISAYMKHAIYPDGATFEDAYTYFIALREGSLALVAAERRGLRVMDTDRFRALIHNAAQMMEPWQCARIVGHSSGGGISYPAWAALFKYAYPDGALPQMVWKQRMGKDFKNNNPCRIQWGQVLTHVTVLGLEHGTSTYAESPQGLESEFLQHFPLSYFSPRRGLLIARSSEAENAIYMHFDARPDAFLVGHDNADRGVFTLTAFKTAWIDDFVWVRNIDSRKHSLMHIDGLAQDARAPSVAMVRVEDNGREVVATANLTYAYNVQWARNWPFNTAPRAAVTVYDEDGSMRLDNMLFDEAEYGHPHDFGWPADDDGADLGFTREQFNMHGDPDVGFRGMWVWKRKYRETKLDWMVRSVILNRGVAGPGFFMVVDSARVSEWSTSNMFESYLMLADGVQVETQSSNCNGNRCRIVLVNDDGIAQVDVHVSTMGQAVSYRVEKFSSDKEHTRLIIRSDHVQEELFWMAFHPHVGEPERFSMEQLSPRSLKAVYDDEEFIYGVDSDTHGIVQGDRAEGTPPASPSSSPSPSASISVTPSASASPTPSATVSPSVSPSVSPTVSPTASPTPSVSATPSPSVSASPSVSPTASASALPSRLASPSPSNSFTPSPSVSAKPSVSASSSATPSVSSSPSPSSAATIPSSSASITPSPTPSVSRAPKRRNVTRKRWLRRRWWRRNWWQRRRHSSSSSRMYKD